MDNCTIQLTGSHKQVLRVLCSILVYRIAVIAEGDGLSCHLVWSGTNCVYPALVNGDRDQHVTRKPTLWVSIVDGTDVHR